LAINSVGDDHDGWGPTSLFSGNLPTLYSLLRTAKLLGTGSYKPLVTGITAITVSVSIHFEVKEVSGHFLSMKVCEELTTLLIILLYN
jgi:hypothetical protein